MFSFLIQRKIMEELQVIKAQLIEALTEIGMYEDKQTKAASARIRKILGNIKKQVTGVRAALVAADKA
jgi:ElaB/YqjD/DUF883 family membrane-anchored ribosome-binding protein